MFQSNSRIEKFKGLRFYEQDILMDDNIYSGDSQIVLNLDYLTPGIGLILMNYNKNLNEMYLFRIGYKESSVVYKLGDITKTMFVTSTILTTPVENMIVTFSKVGRVIKITHDTLGELLSYTLPNIMDKFYLGLYSNAGNIINSMSVATGIPDYWNINMKNLT
jgi:hypothetical protein